MERPMEPYEKRLVADHKELASKLDELNVFITDSPVFKTLDGFQQRLLVDQRAYMTAYSSILKTRISMLPQ